MGTPSSNNTKPPSPTKGSVTDKSPRPILKRKSTPGTYSLLGSARFEKQEIIQEGKPDMAASFLQFCAMCEKQIMTPSNAILYCSEACRRKDSLKPLSAAVITTSSITPPNSEPPSPRQVLSPRVPTGYTPDAVPTITIPADLHDHSSDLDPTEWKPKLPERSSSEAFRYLSRFHRGTMLDEKSEHGGAATSMPALSLGNTPTTTESSLSTSGGLAARYSGSYGEYDFNTRPLPMRQNRWYGSYGGAQSGIDLVTPHVVPSATGSNESLLPADSESLRWEKRKVMFATHVRSDDGLSVLFAEHK